MNHQKWALFSLFCALATSLCFATEGSYVADEVLVRFRGDESARRRSGDAANRAIMARHQESISQLGVSRVKLPRGLRLDDAIAYYNSLPNVEYAEGNPLRYQSHIPNDPRWNSQYGQARMKCPEAWDLTKGSSSVIIAIIDDGIAASHEDLNSKRVPGFDFVQGDTNPSTTANHGTHVAGIAAAATDNGKGVAGTGFNCRIMPIRIFPNGAAARSAQAIIYAADNGARVISMSYGGYPESTTERNAVNYAWNKGVVLVAASGNQGQTTPTYPAAYPNVIGVGSTGPNDLRSGFSNYGESWVSVGAPGEGILSTINGGYGNNTGTSMATPMVAGVIGLLWSYAPAGTTASEVRTALESNTDLIPNGGFAFGRVNAYKALLSLQLGPPQISPPGSTAPWLGSGATGSLADLLASDSAFYRIGTVPNPAGHVAGIISEFEVLDAPSSLREGSVSIEANGPIGATGQVFLYDFSRSTFNSIKSFSLRPNDLRRERILLPADLSNYVSDGNLRLGIRAIGPNRPFQGSPTGSFELKVGFVELVSRSLTN